MAIGFQVSTLGATKVRFGQKWEGKGQKGRIGLKTYVWHLPIEISNIRP